MKIKVFSMCLILFYGLLLSTGASAAQITTIGTGHDPAIYLNNVTWSDNSGSIHIYDLNAQNDTTLYSSNSSHAAIYDNTIVWHDESSGTPRLTVYDLPSGTMSYITENVDGASIPKIYGNSIVWSSNGNVYLFDRSTSTQTQIAVGNSPDIYDTKVVYASSAEVPESDTQGIRMYDINTKEAITICSEGDASAPHIYGNKVIWSDFYTRLGHIKMYDISTKETIDVTNANSFIGEPINSDQGEDTGFCAAINGDKIVYVKISNDTFGNAGLYVYNISTAQSTQVIGTEANVYETPNIYDDTIVWGYADPRMTGASNDIDVCKIEPTVATQSPVANFVSSVSSGEVPLSVAFTDTSSGTPVSRLWDFGDGADSTEQNPMHTYVAAGNYTVNLTVSNANGIDSKTAIISVLAGNTNETGNSDGSIKWGPSILHDTFRSDSIATDNVGHCVEAHVVSGILFYKVGKVNFDTEEIQWGPSIYYDTGSSNSISLDNAGHCVEVHVGSGNLYYRVGKVNFDTEEIQWGPSIYYDTGSSNSISLDNAGQCIEDHVGYGGLYYKVGKVNFDNKDVNWEKTI